MTNLSPDTLLKRKPLAEALMALGFCVASSTLATMATRGGGPPYRTFGRIPLYRWGDAIEWANNRLAAPQPKVRREVTLVVDVEKLKSHLPSFGGDPLAFIDCLLDALLDPQIDGDTVAALDVYGIRVRKHGTPS